jgi:hypothetical protein
MHLVINLSLYSTYTSQSKYLEKQFNDAQGQLRDIVSFYQVM